MAGGNRHAADEALAVALAAGRQVAEAAATAGVHERTAQRRLADPQFAARVRQLRAEMVARASGVLADGMVAAAAVLRTLAMYDGQSVRPAVANIRLKAATKVIELGLKVVELEELQRRVEELERRLNATGERANP